MSETAGDLAEGILDQVATQYRESPRLLGILRHDLREITSALFAIDAIPSAFEIDTAVGEQLSILGRRLGWLRCHCVCVTPPVFGFQCDPPIPNIDIAGFCEPGTWFDCDENGVGDLCIKDDETYRGYLKARRYQMLRRWQIDDLQLAARELWGGSASAISQGGGVVSISPGRDLTPVEEMELPLAFRVLPIAPGIRATLHRASGTVFGFGSGWGGFCDDAVWFCPTEFDPFACPQEVN